MSEAGASLPRVMIALGCLSIGLLATSCSENRMLAVMPTSTVAMQQQSQQDTKTKPNPAAVASAKRKTMPMPTFITPPAATKPAAAPPKRK